MAGVISRWDLLAHPIATIRCFGWGIFFRAVAPWQDRPFLTQLWEAGFFSVLPSSVPRILDRCIDLELRAKRIYRAFAKAFSDEPLVGAFFAALADQEQYHADLLELVQVVATRCGWKANLFNPWQDYLPRLEQQMNAAETGVYAIDSVDAALRLVIEIESSEVNQVFYAALAATDAAFVKRLKPFREAMEAHMAYIVERIPELSPRLTVNVRELRARHRRVRH
jgi:hypothetical protein